MANNINTTVKILKYVLWGCLYLTLITPLLISSRFIFPFITLKTIYFRTLVEIAVFVYLLLALSSSYYRPKFNKLIWFILIFGLIVLLTSLTGLNPYRSFWGTVERGEGFLFIAHLLVFCFIASQAFKTKKEWYNFFTVSLTVSLLVGAYALAQLFKIDWVVGNSNGSRWASSLGNAAYLGAYSLGHFWLAFMLFWQRRRLVWKIFFCLTGLFNVLLLLQSQTRGAMLAFFISLFVYSFGLAVFSRPKKIKLTALMFLCLLVCSLLFVWFNRQQDWIRLSGPVHRLANISFHSITVESRLYAMDSSWQGWQDRFLLGYGWENYNIAFNKYFHPEIYRDAGSQIWFDRAHNTVFDIAVASGLIGLVIYLAIYLSAFIVLIKLVRQQRGQIYLSFSLMAFLTAHFLQNIFVFDSLPTYIMLFMVFAFVAFLSSQQEHYRAEKELRQRPINLSIASLALIILVSCVYYFNYQPAHANATATQGLIKFYQSKADQGLSKFKQAIEMGTYQTPELRQKLAETLMHINYSAMHLSPDQIQGNFSYAINQILLNVRDSAYDVQNYLYLMALYNAASNYTYNPQYLSQVIATGNQALKLSPTRPQIYAEMGRAAIGLGQIKKGPEYFEQAVALNPKTLDSHWNLLTAYIVTGQKNKAEDEYARMLGLGMPENKANLERLLKIYSSVNDFSAIINLSQKLIAIESNNQDYWLKLAAAYQQNKEYKKAAEVAAQIKQKFHKNSLIVPTSSSDQISSDSNSASAINSSSD